MTKRIVLILLVLMMIFSVTGCSNTVELLIGKYTCERTKDQDHVDQASTATIELYEGGNCYVYNLGKEDGEEYNNLSGTWSVEGDILTITQPYAVLGYVVDTSKEPYTLTRQNDTSLVYKKVK